MTLLGIAAAFGVRSMPANAEDLDAGKSAAQLFASDCSSCHRTPYGLAKRMNNSSLDRFLREHYTASAVYDGVEPALPCVHPVGSGRGAGRKRGPAAGEKSGTSRQRAGAPRHD
jgi:hypothetical protein